MTTYGVTVSGFVAKPLTVILAELQAAVTGLFGASFDVSTESPTGQLLGIMADRIAEGWDVAQAVYAAFTPEGSDDVSLDNVCALTGTRREAATFSKVTATLTGTPAASIPAATFSVAGTGTQFAMDAAAVIGGGGTVDAPCTAVEAGANIATSGTLTVIDTPRAGLTSVTNALDAVLGSPLELDAALRIRREQELRASGNAAVESIREKVLALKDGDGNDIVTSCTVFENVGDTTDGNGLPPHSVNVLAGCATGSTIDNEVAAAVYASKGGGIKTYGGTTVTVTDSQGIGHSISFDRPTGVNFYVILNLTIDSNNWPSDGVAQVQAAIIAYAAATLVNGRDVVASAIAAQAFQVSGVLDAPAALIGTAPSPTLTTTIAISLRQIALADTSRITVNTTPGTP